MEKEKYPPAPRRQCSQVQVRPSLGEGFWRQANTVGCLQMASHLRQGPLVGTAAPAKRTPALAAGGTPTPNAFLCRVPSPGGSGPGAQRGLRQAVGGAGRAKIKSKLRESMARSRGRPQRLPCDFDSPIITPN